MTRIALDPYFNAGDQCKRTYNEVLPEIKFELIYDSKADDDELLKLKAKYKESPIIIEDEDIQEDDEAKIGMN